MSSSATEISDLIGREYKEGFVTEIAADTLPPGLDEGVIRRLSAKKNEPKFMLDWRLDAFRRWQEMEEPGWAHVNYPPVEFQNISYYSAPRSSAFRWKSRNFWRGWQGMRYSTACR